MELKADLVQEVIDPIQETLINNSKGKDSTKSLSDCSK